VIVDEETHRQLISLSEEDPSVEVTVDLETQTLTLPDGRQVTFPVDNFSRYCLLNGVDQLGFCSALMNTSSNMKDHIRRV